MNVCVFQEFLCRRTCLTSKSCWIWTSWAAWSQNPVLSLSSELIMNITSRLRCDGCCAPRDSHRSFSFPLHSDHLWDLFELCSFLNKCVISVRWLQFFDLPKIQLWFIVIYWPLVTFLKLCFRTTLTKCTKFNKDVTLKRTDFWCCNTWNLSICELIVNTKYTFVFEFSSI